MNAYKVTVSAREVFQLMKKRREKILKQLLHISLKFVKELSLGLDCCWMWSVIYRKPRTSFNCWRRNFAYAFWSSFTLSPYEWFFPLKAFLSFEIASPLPSPPLPSLPLPWWIPFTMIRCMIRLETACTKIINSLITMTLMNWIQ